jgi:hypothetical protein
MSAQSIDHALRRLKRAGGTVADVRNVIDGVHTVARRQGWLASELAMRLSESQTAVRRVYGVHVERAVFPVAAALNAQRKPPRKRPSYREGVEIIALNDEPLEMDAEQMIGTATVLLLASLFDVTQKKVAADVIAYRAREQVATRA